MFGRAMTEAGDIKPGALCEAFAVALIVLGLKIKTHDKPPLFVRQWLGFVPLSSKPKQ